MGHGDIPLGEHPAHDPQPAKCQKRRLDAHVAAFLVYDIGRDSLIDSGTAWEQVSRLHAADNSRHSEDHLPSACLGGGIEDAFTEWHGRSNLWWEFIRLIYGQKGPFSKVGANRVPVVLFGIT